MYKIHPYTTKAKVRLRDLKIPNNYVYGILDIPSPNFMAKSDRDSIKWGDLVDYKFPRSKEVVHVRAYNSVRGGLVRLECKNARARAKVKVEVEICMVWDESDF